MKEQPKSLFGQQQQHDEAQNFQQQHPSQQEKKPSLRKTMQQLTSSTQSFMTSTETNFKNQAAAIHNLQVQLVRYPIHLRVHPKDHCQTTQKQI